MSQILSAKYLILGSLLLIAVVLIALVSYFGLRRLSAARRGSILWTSMIMVAGATVLLMIGLQLADAPLVLTNDHRLAPSAALVRGLTVYHHREQGPALCTVYGPMTVFTYAAAAMISTPSAAVRAGLFTNILMFYLPALFLLWTRARQTQGLKLHELLLVMVACTMFNETLLSSSTMIHADAPAVGLGTIGCAFVIIGISRRKNWPFVVAGLFSACSVFSKQNMLPSIPVIGLLVLLAVGYRAALLYGAGFVAAAGSILLVSVGLLGDWQALVYNLIYIPSHHSIRKATLVPTLSILADLTFLFAVFAVAGLAVQMAVKKTPMKVRDILRDHPSLLFLLVGIALVVTSILGKIKVVGSINTLSPTIYFLFMAFMLELQRFSLPFRQDDHDFDYGRVFQRGLAGAIIVFFTLLYLPTSSFRLAVGSGPDPLREIYDFAKVHPGEVYFPQFPLTTLLAEGKMYHFSWGLADRAEAGDMLKPAYFHQYIPPGAKVAAMTDWVWDEEMYRYLGNKVEDPRHAQLKSFRFYTIRDERNNAAQSGYTWTTDPNYVNR